MSLISDLRKAREIAKFGEEIAMLLIRIGRALHGGDGDDAEEILRTRNREQAAGRAAHKASSNAGPSRADVLKALDYRGDEP